MKSNEMATATLDELKQIQRDNWERSQRLKRETATLLGEVHTHKIHWSSLLLGVVLGAGVVLLTIHLTGGLV